MVMITWVVWIVAENVVLIYKNYLLYEVEIESDVENEIFDIVAYLVEKQVYKKNNGTITIISTERDELLNKIGKGFDDKNLVIVKVSYGIIHL